MPDFVNQQYAARDFQEQQAERQQFGQMLSMAQLMRQQQAMQQQAAMQQAHLKIAEQQLSDQEEARAFQQLHYTLKSDALSDEEKATYVNNHPMKDKFGFQGQITPQGINPFRSIINDMAEDLKTGKFETNRERYAPVVEMFAANPNNFNMRDAPILMQAKQQEQKARTAEAVELYNPVPDEIKQAATWTQQRQQDYQIAMRELADEDVDSVLGEGGAIPVVSPAGPIPLGLKTGYPEKPEPEEAVRGLPVEGATDTPTEHAVDDIQPEPFAAGTRVGIRSYQAQGPVKAVRASLSEGRTAYLDERRAFVDEYERKLNIIKADEQRKQLNARLARVFQNDPEGLKSMGRTGASIATGLPMIGVNHKELYEHMYVNILAQGGPKTPQQEAFMRNYGEPMHAKGQMDQMRMEALGQRIEENEQKQSLSISAAGLGQATEITAQRLQLQAQHDELVKEMSTPTLPPERIAEIKTKMEALSVQLDGLGAAEDETANQTLGLIQQQVDRSQARLARLKQQVSRTPFDRVDAVREQMTSAEKEVELYGGVMQTFARFSNSAMEARKEEVTRETARLKGLDAELQKADLDKPTSDKLMAERDGVANTIAEDEKWLKEGQRERVKAQARLNAHAAFLKKENKSLLTLRERMAKKDELAQDDNEGINEFIERKNRGEPTAAALKATSQNHPRGKPENWLKAWDAVFKQNGAELLPIAQGEYGARINAGENPNKVAVELLGKYKGLTRDDLIKGTKQPGAEDDDTATLNAKKAYVQAIADFKHDHKGALPTPGQTLDLLNGVLEHHKNVDPRKVMQGMNEFMLSPEDQQRTLETNKQHQGMYDHVINTAAKLAGEQVGGISIKGGEAGGVPDIQIGGQIKDPAKLAEKIRAEIANQSEMLPPRVVRALEKLVSSLAPKAAAPAPAPAQTPAAAPTAPTQEGSGLLDRLRNKYLK